jgi:ABC-type transporter Mla subunit MlaD
VYFDESVQGLVSGSLVRFRGVTLGQVSRIAVAPDGRHIQVTCALRSGDLRKQHLAIPGKEPVRLRETPDLRAQQGLIGLSGEEIVLLDFFDPATHPVPTLPFPTPEATIPAVPSSIRSIEDGLEGASARLPALVDDLRDLIDQARGVVGPLASGDVGRRASESVERLDALLATLERFASHVAAARLPEEARTALRDLSATVARIDELIAQLGSSDGLAASAQRATNALGTTLMQAGPVGRDLDETLRQARDTLLSIRRLSDMLQRQPDALLKGVTRTGP